MHNLINKDGIKYETTHPNIAFNTNMKALNEDIKNRIDSLFSNPNFSSMVFDRFFKDGSISQGDLFHISFEVITTRGAVDVEFEANNTSLFNRISKFADGTFPE